VAELTWNSATVNLTSGYILYDIDGFPAFKLDTAKKVECAISETEFKALIQSGATTESVDEMLVFTDDGFAYFTDMHGSKLYGRYYNRFYDIQEARVAMSSVFDIIAQGVPESAIDASIRNVIAFCDIYCCFPESKRLQSLLSAVSDDFHFFANNPENVRKINLRVLANACNLAIDKVRPLLRENEDKEWTYQDYQNKKQREAEAERQSHQRDVWRSQGLCFNCGGQLGIFKKCKSCGNKN